ncbi:MAG: hypothetical protein ACR2QM_13560 [Longimicrobiales bacterium]
MNVQDSITRIQRDDRGFALAATLVVLVLMSALVFAVADGALISTRASTMEYQSSRAFYAAEAGAEVAMAQLEAALEDGNITQAELDSITPPTITDFNFDNFIVTPIGAVSVTTITDGHFAGLYSLNQSLGIYSEASDAIGNSNASIITVNAQAIPIFQFGVFYEKDLEIHNGPSMWFAGWVHSNGSIYLSSNNAWYEDVVTTPNKVFHDRKSDHDVKWGVYVDDALANDVQLDFDSRTHPVASDFISYSNANFDNRIKTDAYGVDTLRVPLPAGVSPIEVVQPRQLADGTLERRAKFSWKADWYIELDMDDDDTDTCDTLTHTRTGSLVTPSSGDCDDIFEMKWDAFWEEREQRWADVFEIDVEELADWVAADSARRSQILYVTFTGTGHSDHDIEGDSVFPVVRLVNGDSLPNPMTVASDRGLYIYGDYNSVNWQPAAIAGDAMTWLSNAWQDSQNQDGTPSTVQASNTEINAAVLVGHSATPCDHHDGGCGGGNYGGGLENFPRFLERWSGRTMLYKGSLVSLFTSQYSIGAWGYGNPIYQAPGRAWSFDVNFRDPALLPPGTPVVGFVLRTAYRPAPNY